jgi:hypothetical protein
MRSVFVVLGLTVALLLAGSPRAGAADLLANGGFEQGTDGWSLNAGQLDAVPSPVHAGALAGRFSGSGQPTTQFAYQVIAVRPDEDYEASGWLAASGPAVSRAFLRLSWFDAGGQLVSQADSGWLPQLDGSFYRLSTGVLLSPSAARTARVSAIVQAESGFAVHLDDFELGGPAAVPLSATPQATITPSTPTTTPAVPTPKVTPTARPEPTRTLSPTSPAPSPLLAEITEPLFFPYLVNGGFEELRGDGTPYGWHKQGGEISTVSEPRTDGSRALALSSQTSSTKWAYQTLSVTGGAYYVASVYSLAGEGAESAFLRVSWYGSADGTGPAIGSVDSRDASEPGDADWRQLATDAVPAPVGAASAKIRLMLRPISESTAVAHFDSASFAEAQPGVAELVLGSNRPGSRYSSATESEQSTEELQTYPNAQGTPIRLANMKPVITPEPAHVSAAGGNDAGWAIILAIAVAVSAVALAGGYEFWQRRGARGGGESIED